MRFLLHAAAKSSRLTTAKKASESVASAAVSAASSDVLQSSSSTDPHQQAPSRRLQKTWGQQCSPQCGCVVRFETTTDPTTNRIIHADYHAKSLLPSPSSNDSTAGTGGILTTSRDDGISTPRPILVNCNCSALHSLSSSIVAHLPGQSPNAVRNTAEFASVRSSPSFRRAVLVEQGLSRTNTNCYDVVEEAFLACVRGYMVKPRREVDGGMSVHVAKRRKSEGSSSTGKELDPNRYAKAARRAGRSFPGGSRALTGLGANTRLDPASSAPLMPDQPIHSIRSYLATGSASDMPEFHSGAHEDELDDLVRELSFSSLSVDWDNGSELTAKTNDLDWLDHVDQQNAGER